ncbi:GntR family transcriptional regulator [Clostridium tertium]|uniref:GntR family transcriptional regulator n=1 Tax=Clostridium tertium TaxID=1559 RepID=UPI000BE37EE5|nr:GntR family transcriptional regulator [Clostridium tertium]
MENNRSKDKSAKYAKIYNRILRMIEDGMYSEGSKLMPESQLAQELEVSRSTLRQALALLQEDGIIESRQGVGNFIRKTSNLKSTGLEKMDIPIYKACNEEIESVEIEVLPGISTTYTQKIFNRKMAVVLAIHRYYKRKSQVYAYCFTHLASDVSYLNEIDLNDNNQVLNFIEKEVYSLGHSKRCDIEIVKETENLHNKQIKNTNRLFVLIRETITDIGGDVILVNKFYIPIEIASIKVFSNN